MILNRCQDQKSQTLEQFYSDSAGERDSVIRYGDNAMLALIARIRRLPGDRRIYGLTSMRRLCLLATDTWKSPWYVILSALDDRNYTIEYRMPDESAPWPHAYVKGEARSEDQAIEMLLIAMDESGGWKNQ